MKTARYTVVDTGGAADNNSARVFSVTGSGGRPVSVWCYPHGKCYCQKCSGPLAAMLTSCRHAQAVKRHIARKADGEKQ
jgi:hypothetical protein